MKPRIRLVDIIRIIRLGDRSFAEKRSDVGEVYWEEISTEEADRFLSSPSAQSLEILLSPPTSPVLRILQGGKVEYGSAICYKGIGPDGRHEYWHIPTGTVLVEEEGYALRQIAGTMLILERWLAKRRLAMVGV